MFLLSITTMPFSLDSLINELGTIPFVLVGILLFSALIQILYYIFIYGKLFFYKRKIPRVSKKPVSVIICAKNEEENLKKFLPGILAQDYPEYEVIVVNDCSTDGTALLLAEFKEKYPHLYYTTIEPDRKFMHGKKLAISIGIKAAKSEWLLFTDADCQPVSKSWISRMQENFSDKRQIVLGYGGYFKRKTLLNLIIRYDTAFIAATYFSYALAGIPYMGVGRNLAYRKSLFFEKKGFGSHKKLLSGDDDLFVNKHGRKKNIRIEISRDSHTLSEPEKHWKN